MIAAVVVTFSAPAGMLSRCVDSLRAAGGIDRIIVVDTGGHSEPAGINDPHGPSVEWLSIENRGYGAAANAGFEWARRAGADLFALLNDDVIVSAGWVEHLADELTSEHLGAAQPMLLAAGAAAPRVNSLGVSIGPDGAGVDIGAGDPPPVDATPSDLELFTGGAVLFSGEFLTATGGFDERYFLYYEDVDLALRGAELGWTYRLVPASVVEHVGGVSTGATPDRTLLLQERNRLWAAARFADTATVARAFWLSVRRLRHAPRRVHGRALLSGFGGAPNRLLARRRGRAQPPR
jgi:GT2 family glycosyltransferase